MPDEIGPAVRRRQLGRMLRDFRMAAGFLSMEAAAERTGFSRATISRIESAKQTILPRTVRTLCAAYGIGAPTLDHLLRLAEESDDRGWMVAYSDTTPQWFERYVGEESDATEIWTYQQEYVPGLLQTRDYSRAMSAASRPDVVDGDLDRRVALRQARQDRLAARPGQQLIAIINEAALRRRVGGAEVMREQLLHLRGMAQRPNVEVQVLPFSVGAHPAMAGSFSMLHFPPDIGDPTIYIELDSGALYPDRPVDFDRRTWIFQRLRELALPVKDTDDLLGTVAGEENPGE